jgi:hypothetical protein
MNDRAAPRLERPAPHVGALRWGDRGSEPARKKHRDGGAGLRKGAVLKHEERGWCVRLEGRGWEDVWIW